MIERHWRGLCRAQQASAYIEHLEKDTFPAVRRLAGFLDARILHRQVPQGVEFLVVTRWESLEAIRAFAGDDVEAAVVPQNVRAMMIEFDAACRHYTVVDGGAAS